MYTGQEYFRDPHLEELLYLIFEDLGSSHATRAATPRESSVRALDEFHLASTLLPSVLRLFQKRYRDGFLEYPGNAWSVYTVNLEAE